MLRPIRQIFPYWHRDPLTDESLEQWFEDATADHPSIAQMEHILLSEPCPYRREAKATRVLRHMKQRGWALYGDSPKRVLQMIEQARRQQQRYETQREGCLSTIQERLKYERKRMEDEILADYRRRMDEVIPRMQELENQLIDELFANQFVYQDPQPDAPSPPESPAAPNPPVFTQRNQVPLCKNTPDPGLHWSLPSIPCDIKQ